MLFVRHGLAERVSPGQDNRCSLDHPQTNGRDHLSTAKGRLLEIQTNQFLLLFQARKIQANLTKFGTPVGNS